MNLQRLSQIVDNNRIFLEGFELPDEGETINFIANYQGAEYNLIMTPNTIEEGRITNYTVGYEGKQFYFDPEFHLDLRDEIIHYFINPSTKIKDSTDKEKAAQLRQEYKALKFRAHRLYHDPIDYPSDIKQRLQQLSAQATALDPKVRSDKSIEAENKRRKESLASKRNIEKELKKEFPYYEKANDIKWDWTSLNRIKDPSEREKKREKITKKFKDLGFRLIGDLKEYIVEANAFKRELQKESKSSKQ